MSLIEKRTEREATFGDLTGKFTYDKTYTYINFKNTFPFSWLYNSYYLFRYCLLKLKITKTAPVNGFMLNFGYKRREIIRKIKKIFNKNNDLIVDDTRCSVCRENFKDDVFCEFMVSEGYEAVRCRACFCRERGIKNTYKDIVEYLEKNLGGALCYVHEKKTHKRFQYVLSEEQRLKTYTFSNIHDTFTSSTGSIYDGLRGSFFNTNTTYV